MAKNDVELTVRMRNEASKVADAITAAFEKLTTAQNKVSSSAGDAGGALARFAAEANNLMGKLDKDRAFERMANDVVQASTALKAQQVALSNTQGELQSYQRQLTSAASVQARLRKEVADSNASLDTQKQALRDAQKELTQMQKAVSSGAGTRYGFPTTESQQFVEGARQAAVRVDELRASIAASTQANQGLRSQLSSVDSAYRTLQRQSAATEKSIEGQTAAVNEQRSALQALSSTVTSVEQAQARMTAAQTQAAESAARVGIAQRRAAVEMRTLAEQSLSSTRADLTGPLASITSLQKAVRESNVPLKQQQELLNQLSDAANRAKAAPAELSTAISLLNRELRSSGASAQSVNAAMANVDAAMKRTASATAGLGTAMSNSNNALRQNALDAQAAARATGQLGAAETAAAANKRQLNDALREYNDGARRTLDFTQRIRGQILSLTAAYLGLHNAIGQIGEVISAFQSLEAAQNRLGAVFNGDEARVGQELDFLRRTADRLGISFQVLADEYGKFAVATNGTNLAGEETRRIFLAVAEAGRVNKLSLDNMQGTYLALTQMVSKGKVQSEELRRQLGDRLPGAFNIMAAALGKTTAQLDQAMQNGEVTSDALSAFATELQKRFGPQLEKSLTSTTTAIGRFQNQVYQLRLAFGQAGFIEAFTEGLNELNKSLATPEFQSFLGKISVGLGAVVKGLAAIPEHAQAITVAFAAFIGLKLGAYVATAATQFIALRTQITATTTATQAMTLRTNNARSAILAAAVATRSWGTALGLLGGPIGIAITGITAAIGLWATRADSATVAMTNHRRAVDQVKNSYEKNAKAAYAWAENVGRATETQARANLAALTAEYDKQAAEIQKAISATVTQARSANSPMSDADRQSILATADLVDKLRARTITLDEFRQGVDELAKATTNPNIGRGLLALLERSEGMSDVSNALKQADLVVKAITGSADEAKKAMAELNGEFKKTDPITDATDKLKKYQAALNDIKEGIPGLTAEAKRTDALEKLGKKAAELVASVGEDPLGLPSEAQALIRQRIAAIEAEYNRALLAAAPKISQGLVERIVRIESSGNADARNKRSSAAGLGQFLDDTWVEQFTKVFPAAAATMDRAAILMYKTGEQNRDTQLKVLENFTQENISKLLQAGIAPTSGNAYLAHFLGADGAIKVILANPDTLAKDLVGAGAVSANPTVFTPGMTSGGLQKWAANLMGGSAPILDSGLTKVETEQAELYQKQETALKRINKELDERVNKIKQSNTEAEIANSLAEAGLDISSKEGQALAAKIRDSRATADAEEKVNFLLQQRALLQEQIKYQQEQEGNLSAVQTLQAELQGVNTQLTGAINNAIAMWQAIGGPQADQAVLRLRTQQNTIQQSLIKNVTVAGVLTASFDNIASSGTTAFMSVAESIWAAASGQITWNEALKQMPQFFAQMVAEVLLGIAKMILQQTILNGLYMIAAAFGWYGPGAASGGASTAAAASSSVNVVGGGIRLPQNHSGGFPGQGGTANISTASVLSALSYDGGGARALSANEQLTVVKDDEEVVTGTDPRHSRNGGGAGAQQPVQLKIVNAIDSGSVVSAGLDTVPGQEAILNFIQANRTRVRGLLSM